VGVELSDSTQIEAESVIYSGTVWNLYGRMISEQYLSPKRKAWAKAMVPTYPSVVFYAEVDSSVIPDGTCPVEMLVGNPDQIDEGEVTVYIFSIDDHTLCPAGRHTVMAIGPSFRQWPAPVGDYHSEDYLDWKEAEQQRLTAVLEQRFPGFTQAIYQSELATPVTIERYTLKNGGSVAGPKQMIGQHMLHRLHTCTEWRSLYCCGESTVMGTGSPAVTVSGISAANAVLHRKGLKPFVYDPRLPNLVRILQRPVKQGDQNQDLDPYQRELIRLAGECQFCEDPACMSKTKADIRGIMRRAAVGNFAGARTIIGASGLKAKSRRLIDSEQRCIRKEMAGSPVAIRLVFEMLETVAKPAFQSNYREG
jgi:prolycopene isomerase